MTTASSAGSAFASNIPYVNRLFKNVGMGRETQSLMMMVTPRIIKSSDVSEEIYQQALKEAQRYDYFRNKYGEDDAEGDDSDDEVGSSSNSGEDSDQG